MWFEASRRISQLRVVYKIVSAKRKTLYTSGDFWPNEKQSSAVRRLDGKYKYEVMLPSFVYTGSLQDPKKGLVITVYDGEDENAAFPPQKFVQPPRHTSASFCFVCVINSCAETETHLVTKTSVPAQMEGALRRKRSRLALSGRDTVVELEEWEFALDSADKLLDHKTGIHASIFGAGHYFNPRAAYSASRAGFTQDTLSTARRYVSDWKLV